MSYDSLIGLKERAEDDEKDRCQLCGSLLMRETITPEKGEPYQWVWCGNDTCNAHKRRKVTL